MGTLSKMSVESVTNIQEITESIFSLVDKMLKNLTQSAELIKKSFHDLGDTNQNYQHLDQSIHQTKDKIYGVNEQMHSLTNMSSYLRM